MAQDTTVTIPVDAVKVGERRRVDYGDLTGLTESIRRHGLLHPPVVDAAYNLVAGGRRLRAVAALGWHEVPVRLLGSLSDAELRMVELEENTRRKDLTPSELSRNLAALADTAAQVDREEAAAVGFTLVPKTDVAEGEGGEETCSNLEQVVAKRGPDQTPGSLRRVAERIGVAPSEIVRARQHVAAVEAHPEVAAVPQSTAIAYAKAVEAQPEVKGQPVAPVVSAYREQRQAARQETPVQKEDRLLAIVGDEEGNIARARLRQSASSAVYAARSLWLLKADAIVGVLDDAGRASIRETIRDGRKWFDDMERALGRPMHVVKEQANG